VREVDKKTYAPFILVRDAPSSLLLSDADMVHRCAVFEEVEGWLGSGYDWAAVAEVVVTERLAMFKDQITFHPEGGMFSAVGELVALERLGGEMQQVFLDVNLLRQMLNRAKLD
jgi:hypothetical protein